jgi:hypothetical protein
MQDFNVKRPWRARRFALHICTLAALLATSVAGATSRLVIYGQPSPLAIVGSRYTFTPKAGGPTGYTLTFSISGKPGWASFSTKTGQLSGAPTTANIGKYGNIIITVRDSAGSTSLPAFAISVAAASSTAPSISGTPATSIAVGRNYVFTPKASGPTGYPLSFSITGKPAWASFSRVSGQLVGAPTTANVGKYSNIIISVSDGVKSASLAPFAISVTTGGSTTGPTISGSPPTTATVGTAYAFTPKATVPTGMPLSFSVRNKPAWASFSIATGKISGTPTASNVGTYSSIVISASDGAASASLAPFSIVVSQPSSTGGTGSATLHWTAPTTNTNGSALTNLAGYHIYYGKSSSTMTTSVTITNPGTTSHTISNLAAGTWFFCVNAYTTSGMESARSNIGSKAIP